MFLNPLIMTQCCSSSYVGEKAGSVYRLIGDEKRFADDRVGSTSLSPAELLLFFIFFPWEKWVCIDIMHL